MSRLAARLQCPLSVAGSPPGHAQRRDPSGSTSRRCPPGASDASIMTQTTDESGAQAIHVDVYAMQPLARFGHGGAAREQGAQDRFREVARVPRCHRAERGARHPAGLDGRLHAGGRLVPGQPAENLDFLRESAPPR